ncbi:MAG: response regulator transcription factor [Acidobacteria bacterium]|nr:response regulator transcription factor [Acidobacteriota bacterium]
MDRSSRKAGDRSSSVSRQPDEESGSSADRAPRLTPREREIVLAILDGCTNREMARRFAVTEQTVKNQLTSLYDKAGISSRLELALVALQKGLVEAP